MTIVFTDEQLANLSAIAWLYRGEHEKFTVLVHRHQQTAADWLAQLPQRLAADSKVGRKSGFLRLPPDVSHSADNAGHAGSSPHAGYDFDPGCTQATGWKHITITANPAQAVLE